jgi:2-hydroxy-3-keto-5-methylthiopentenyl-1-phosphate phosphatase
MRKIKQNIAALVYDFDGTLTPKAMQEYTVLPHLGVKETKRFWREVQEESIKNGEEKDLVWMRKIKEMAEKEEKLITRKYFKKQGRNINYFPGVESFFNKVNSYVKRKSKGKMKIRHYIVSSGLKEILDGISIRRKFYNVFGSEYHYDYRGIPSFPKVVITDTVKTQYLFRINKGKENLGESINEYMPEELRPIPFKNIIYIGDGLTDVPAMNVTKKSDGYAIAVYRPWSSKGIATCKRLLRAGRVDFIAQADYRQGSALYKYVICTLDIIIEQYKFDKYVKHHHSKLKNGVR